MHLELAIFSIFTFPSSYKGRRCRREPPSHASGTSRALSRQRERHGGELRYRSWTSGMLAAQRFADRAPPFSTLSVLSSCLLGFFYTSHLPKTTAKVHVPKGESLSQRVPASVLSLHASVNNAENADDGAHNFAQCLRCCLR